MCNYNLLFSTTANKDFDSRQKQFTVGPAQTRNCAEIRIINDFKYEPLYETFHVELTSLHPRVHLNNSRMNVTIEDKDGVCGCVCGGGGGEGTVGGR